MNNPLHAAAIERPGYEYNIAPVESSASAVSWGAVIAGGIVAAALSLALVTLGSGLGLSSVSPWENAGASAKTIGIAGAIWLAFMQLVSASLGGYIAGRLRTKWVNVHTDEVFFRDTAHGFLVWALGLVMTASFMTSAVTSLVGGGAQAGADALTASGVVTAAASRPATGNGSVPGTSDPNAYWVDQMLRTDKPTGDTTAGAAATPSAAAPPASAPPADLSPRANDVALRAELGRILSVGFRNGGLAPADRAYLAQTVSARAGLSPADADKRVADVISRATAAADEARAAADKARKAAAYFSLWIFISLLIGAFCASYAATVGGRLRDRVAV
jgi:hypothetical protein